MHLEGWLTDITLQNTAVTIAILWEFKSCGMWCCVTGLMVPSSIRISHPGRYSGALIFLDGSPVKLKAPHPFKTSVTRNLWQTHCHIPEDLKPQQHCCEILQLSFLFLATQNPDLIGDFSKPFILPLMEGRHQDLKTISADTLASLLNGDFSEEIESYVIIDCR